MTYRSASRVVLVAVVPSILLLTVTPSLGARPVQGAVGQVTPADGAALGPVGFRIYSGLPGGETNTNDNTASCRNVRCPRGYITNVTLDPGGYVSNQETTFYNGDLQDQPFYELVDASMNDSTGCHIGYFGVSGVTANNSGTGNPLGSHCPPPTATNCFDRIDLEDAGPVIPDTHCGYGGPPHTIRPISGLNPIPIVGVVTGASCAAGQACLFWPDPHTYIENMRPSNTGPAPPSPVKGVRLYKNFTADCSDPAGNDPGWTPIGSFDLGQNSTQDPLPQGAGCNFYATTVRLVGPGGDPNEMETFRIGAHSLGVGSSPETAIRIVRFGAVYAGHGIVNVTWRSGNEGDVQSYFVTRGLSPDGPYERVSDVIHPQGDGHDYMFSNRVPAATRTYYYRLEILIRAGGIVTSSVTSAVVPERGRRSRPSIR